MNVVGAAQRDPLGIYGKIPAQGDFVRVNASDASAQSLDQWIQESLEALTRLGTELPHEPVYFIHQGAVPGALPVVGTMLRSTDRVGRVYPLVVFARLDPQMLSNGIAVVPTAYSAFLHDAARLAGDGAFLDAQALATRARSLRVPTALVWQQTHLVAQHILQTNVAGELYQRLFSPPPVGRHFYAFKTAIDACDTTRNRPPRVPITLACPIMSDIDLFVWIELCQRRLTGTSTSLACVWCEGPTPRMLLSLGHAQASLLRFLCRPEDQATQLWPLTTARSDASEQAWHALAPHHRQALETPAMLLEVLLATLAR